MLLRRALDFIGLVVGHYLASYAAIFFCYAMYMQPPASVIVYIFFFPTLLSDATGAGVVPTGDDSLADTPLAMVVNSLWSVVVLLGGWLVFRWAASRPWVRSAATG